MQSKDFRLWMRILHRYIGFFLLLIMAVYAVSGTILMYRDTNIFKKEVQHHETFKVGATEKELGKKVHQKEFKIERKDGNMIYFKDGIYHQDTGILEYKTMDYPWLIEKMNSFHKTKTKTPHSLFWLTTIFAIMLLFFAISSFWMFPTQSKIFKKGMKFFGVGVVLCLFVLFW